MSIALGILRAVLAGRYVAFGVFRIYNDPVLDDAMHVILRIIASIPLPDLMAYTKLCKSYFAFIDVLFSDYLSTVPDLDSGVYLMIMQSLDEGLRSSSTFHSFINDFRFVCVDGSL
jgi:exportin-7